MYLHSMSWQNPKVRIRFVSASVRSRCFERVPPRIAWFGICLTAALLSFTTAHASNQLARFIDPGKLTAFEIANAGYNVKWMAKMTVSADTAYAEQEYFLASRLWLAMAEQGDQEAAFKLGMSYEMGRGLEQDAQRAVYWYMRAAQAGHLHAQHNLAVAYANGDGIQRDIEQAMQWWQLAAHRGNRDSQYNLGIVYATGTRGVDRDIELAKYWWSKAARSGDPQAQFNLGTLYANTDGKSGRFCEAIHWWEESARNGVQQASRALRIIKMRRDYVACR